MPEEFYTLEQAAARLEVPPERLRQMAQRNEIRVFVDRGNWRFRASEIEEMRRRLGVESSSEIERRGPRTPKPEARSGDGGPRTPRPTVPVSDAGPRTPKPAQPPRPPEAHQARETMLASPDVFPFDFGGEQGAVDLASLFAQGPRAPGSDSDVRLVPEGSDINLVVLPPEPEKPSSRPSDDKGKPESQVRLEPAQPQAEPQKPRLSQLDVSAAESDSDVRLLDVEAPQIAPAPPAARRDSQIRLEPDRRSDVTRDSGIRAEPRSPEGSDSTLQLELNLEEELQQAEAQRRAVSDSSEERAAAEMLQDDERTEFEGQGSEFELQLPEEMAQAESEESGTFRIKEDEPDVARGPAADSSSNQSLALESGEGSATEELSFDLSLDEEGTEVTPRPESAKRTPDSSSEFELTVQEDDSEAADTDLLSGVGSQAGRSVQEADTELEETSDFDLQLVEEEETPAASESDRETEVIIDETAQAEEETQFVEGVAEELSDLGIGEGLEFVEPGSSEVQLVEEEPVEAVEEEAAPVVRYVELAPADWGLWAIMHVPTTLILVFVGLLLFELIRSVLYYHEPGMMGGPIYDLLASLFRR